jgi:hypothetical protein
MFYAIYLDFQKVFDTVPHHRLITKLKGYGISGNILEWIKNFLSVRKQKVVLNGSNSKWTDGLGDDIPSHLIFSIIGQTEMYTFAFGFVES